MEFKLDAIFRFSVLCSYSSLRKFTFAYNIFCGQNEPVKACYQDAPYTSPWPPSIVFVIGT